MTFLVVAAGHSGTKFLASQLAMAEGWTVLHEPNSVISARIAARRFLRADNYGEVNSFLLTAARRIPSDRRAVLLRNPYDLAKSIACTGHLNAAMYVRECISMLDNLARDGWQTIRFPDITSDPAYVVRCARRLGIATLRESDVDVATRVNKHRHGLDEPPVVEFDPPTVREFDAFTRRYRL